MADEDVKKFEEYLKSMTPQQAEALHKQLLHAVKEVEEFDQFVERQTRKGTVPASKMVMDAPVTIKCRCCGGETHSIAKSSSTQPIQASVPTCGDCVTNLSALTKDDLVQRIIKRELEFYYGGARYMKLASPPDVREEDSESE